ncbi:urea transporter [Burkholderia sp. FERM BP-3421]|jgi:urea transporter|uniref:urea transporter n=1 Tax=Burkholderia sp. FERM BP-3421 TaxID=1494466 RepID=UPI0023628917|nr:urea transporter [Burkholderia sp. FERM BP-3421]WDD91983.1 urea transporter [Burkholderia sp. FERM BP-3421]
MLAATVPLPTELRILLRSLGQIVLQANAATGACVLAALACTGLPAACAALLGATAANVVAHLAGHDRAEGRQGLHGFNGALAALAAVGFSADASTGFGLALLAASLAGWACGPIGGWLRTRGLCAYSSPCLAVTACWLPFHAAAPHAGGAPGWTLGDALGGGCAGVAQAAFAQGIPAGLWMLLGLAAASRRAATFAFGGALAGSLALVALGAPDTDAVALRAGLLGFNGALTALALAGRGVPTAAVGVAMAVLAQWFALRAGLTVLTLPFVLATWLTLVARRTTDGILNVLRTPR